MIKDADYIHQLIARKLAGTINALDESYLDDLIEADPLIRKTWLRMQATIPQERSVPVKWISGSRWNISSLLAAAVVSSILIASAFLIWHTTNSGRPVNRIEVQNNPSIVQLKLSNGKMVDLSTASDTVRVGNARILTANKTLAFIGDVTLPEGINTIFVPVGKTYRVILPDGSTVWLNSTTEMQFPTAFSGNSRKVKIKGEAYLEVVADASKPFLVEANTSNVLVLGTAFNINNYDDQLKVSLVAGSVKVATAKQAKLLKPGEQAVIGQENQLIVQEFEQETELAWRNGAYYFTDATLAEIAKVIPRWYSNQVEIEDPAIGKQRYTGRMLRDMPVTQFLETLKATTLIQYTIDNKGTIHFR